MLVEYGRQYTIKNEVQIGGWGIHTGGFCWLTLKPADPDRGIVFRRVDQEGQPEVTAHPGNLYSSGRATSLICPEGRRREKRGKGKSGIKDGAGKGKKKRSKQAGAEQDIEAGGKQDDEVVGEKDDEIGAEQDVEAGGKQDDEIGAEQDVEAGGKQDDERKREKKREVGDIADIAREENKEIDGFLVKTVEHLLASFGAIGIDNVIVEMDSSELPSEEGSAIIYYFTIEDCGFKQQENPRQYLVPERPLAVSRGNSYLLVLPPEEFQAPDPRDVSFPGEKLEELSLELEYQLDYGEEPPGYQNYRFSLPLAAEPKVRFREFDKGIAAARTFALEREFEDLQRMGLAQSGKHKEPLLFNDEGANQRLRFPEEPARHKLLDLLGDLYLAGPLAARVLAVRSGHQLNQEMAGLLADMRSDLS